MLRLPLEVVAERAADNTPGVPAPGNPAARRPNTSSPRTPPADWWQRMQFPPEGYPQSPRSRMLQHDVRKGGGWYCKRRCGSISMRQAWQVQVTFFAWRKTLHHRCHWQTRAHGWKRRSRERWLEGEKTREVTDLQRPPNHSSLHHKIMHTFTPPCWHIHTRRRSMTHAQVSQNVRKTARPKTPLNLYVCIYIYICCSFGKWEITIQYSNTEYNWDRICRRVEFFWFPIYE